MSPAVLHNRLTCCEVDNSLAPDCRRVLREERFALSRALRSGDSASIRAAADEALRVARMWGVSLS